MASPSLAVALLGMTLILAAASAAEGGFPKAASAREKVALEEEAKTASTREKAAHSSTAACRAWFALPPAERPKKKECDWESWSNPTSGGASQGAHEYGPHTSKEHAEYGPQKQVPVGVGSKWPLKSEREESWADPKSGPGARHFDHCGSTRHSDCNHTRCLHSSGLQMSSSNQRASICPLCSSLPWIL